MACRVTSHCTNTFAVKYKCAGKQYVFQLILRCIGCSTCIVDQFHCYGIQQASQTSEGHKTCIEIVYGQIQSNHPAPSNWPLNGSCNCLVTPGTPGGGIKSLFIPVDLCSVQFIGCVCTSLYWLVCNFVVQLVVWG